MVVVALLAVAIGQALSWAVRSQPSGAFAACHTARQVAPRAYSAPPPMCIDTKRTYTATVHTTKGDLKITMFPSVAPQTVNNFVVLAVNGYFDGLRFFRHGSFYWQAGDPNEDGSGGPGYLLPPENTVSQPFDPGSVAMARFPGGISGGQFFLTTDAWPGGGGPDAEYNHFGMVTGGNDVLGNLSTSDRITRVEIARS